MARKTELRIAHAVLCACLALTGACTVSVGNGDGFDFDADLFEDGSVPDAASADAATTKDGGGAGSGGEMDAGQGDGGSEPPDSGTGSESPVKDVPHQIAQATCTALQECLGGEDLLNDTFGGRDCTALTENLLRAGSMHYLPASVESGFVLYRPEQVDGCLSDLRALGCKVRSSRLPASCQLMLIGTQQQGESCGNNFECAGDAFCDKGALETCPGTCASLQAEGLPCNHNDDDQCEDGLVCFDGSCEALGALGDDCGAGLPRCAPGLLCAGGECVAQATVYVHTVDEACEPGVELCESGLVCESTDSSMGVCKAPVGKGASCKRADPNQCPLSQYCDAENPGETGTCVDRPGDGEPCLSRSQSCADGHACIEGTCRKLAQVDESCIADAQCYSGSCGSDSLCEGPLMCEL